MAIDEDLVERLTQDDVFYNSDLGSLVGYRSDECSGGDGSACERVASLKLAVLEVLWRNKDAETKSEDEECEDEDLVFEAPSLNQRLPLLLLIPLLKSGAKSDPSLVETTSGILFEYLKSSPPLNDENSDELDSLEDLLVGWGFNPAVVSALVALAASRGSLKTILNTIQFLHTHKAAARDMPLKVGHLLKSLSPYGSDPKPPLPSKISERWGIKDYRDLSYGYEDQEDEFRRKRLAVSSDHIYLLSGNEGLVKVGNGREGGMRGHIYAHNPSLNTGFVAYASGTLLLHSANEKFQIIDTNTLKATAELQIDPELLLEGAETLHFISDGAQFFWIRSQFIVNADEGPEDELQITLDIFDVQNGTTCSRHGQRVFLRQPEIKTSESSTRRPSEKQNRLTSTGLDIKTLFQAPALTCGRYVTFLTHSSQKSLYANRQAGSCLSHSFLVQSGEFFGKHDITDVFHSKKEFKKKSLLSSSVLAYDTINDLIWMVSAGGVTGFTSSAFKSLAYVKNSLRIPLKTQDQEFVRISDVKKELLRKGALYCSFQGEQAAKTTLNTDIQVLLDILSDSLQQKDVETSLCALKILSKAGLKQPTDISICDLFNEHPLLKDTSMEVYLERITNNDDKLKCLMGSPQTDLKAKLLKALSSFQRMKSSIVLKTLEKEEDFLEPLILECIQDSLAILGSPNSNHPKYSPHLEFLVCFISRYAYYTIREEKGFKTEDFAQTAFKTIRLIIDKCLNPIVALNLFQDKKHYEQAVKSTILGTFLHSLVTVLFHPKFQTLEVIKNEAKDTMYKLWRSISEIASLQWKRDDAFSTGFLSGIPEPDSWEPYRVLESVHPINNTYKYEENMNFHNIPFIYLLFDTRCAIEAEDKLIINRWNRTLAEFTQATWPEMPYKIEWPNSLNLKFETKGKQKVWGFRITVSQHAAQLSLQELKLPHMTELSFSVSFLLRSHMKMLYRGPEPSCHEEKSKPLLGLKLLDRCVWDRESITIRRIKLPVSIVAKMRDLTGIKLPPLRPSVKEALGTVSLEEGILASVLKHLSLLEVVENLGFHQKTQTLEYGTLEDILGQTHRRINALIRRLHILADLENQWELEIDCLREGSVSFEDIFFLDYHLNETRWKELTLLGFLKGIQVDDEKREKAVNDLLAAIEKEVITSCCSEEEAHYSKTRKVVDGIMEKIELLLKISINIEEDSETTSDLMTQSLISWPEPVTRKKKFLERERSLDDSILQIPNLKKTHHRNTMTEGKKSTENDILNEIFAFIGSHPEKAVSQDSFLSAIHTRQSRNECRHLSINLMNEILSSAKSLEIGAFMASSLSSIIQDGLHSDEIYFGANSVDKVRDSFTDLTSILTGIASQYHNSSAFIIETLCQIPYEKEDEICLIRNGLVNLLSVLCSEKGHSELAWKGFKSLANRCVAWEQSNAEREEIEVSQDEFGLARQLSIVLTNTLVRVTSSYDEKRNESLEEIISLLAFMSNCQTGKDMLSQPSCISDLLELLLEPMSPKMILEIVQLCYIGLPRMTHESVGRVCIPKWNLGHCREEEDGDSHMKQILDLILAKLSDFLVPGSQVTPVLTTKRPSPKSRRASVIPFAPQRGPPTIEAIDNAHLSLFVHKRKNQSPHEVIQLLLNVNSEVKLFPLGGNSSNMDKVVKMDKDMSKMNKTKVLSGDAALIYHKGTKLVGHGFIVSVAPKPEESNDSQACRDKNLALSRTDPVRPFISSYVSHSIATKLVLLFHSLAESSVWRDALTSVLKKNLELLESIVKSTESLYDLHEPRELFKLYSTGRKVIAVLSIIGAFDWQLKSGDEVNIQGTKDKGKIVSINEDLGIATLSGLGDVLLKRLTPSNKLENQGMNLFSKFILDDLVSAFYTLLTPDSEIGIDPLSAALPANGDGWSLKLAVSRVLAEIRTKSCQLLSLYSNDEEFILSFMRKSYRAIDMLKLVSKDVLPTDDIDLVQRKLKNLKSIYRDCFKPPISRIQKESTNSRGKIETAWNPSTSFPPVSSTLFSYGSTCLAYHGDPVHSSSKQPKGVFIYANSKGIQYFEISILSLGEIGSQSEESLILSIGLSPLCSEKSSSSEETPWNHPRGSMLFHNDGKISKYTGGSQDESLTCEHSFRQGDVIGVLNEESRVQFTYNGTPIDQHFESPNSGSLFPVIHVMKKGVQVKANFGNGGPFRFDEQNMRLLQHRRVSIRIEEAPDVEPSSDLYSFLQFNVSTKNECPGAAGHRRLSNIPSRSALKSKGTYDFRESSYFYSPPNAEPLFKSGAFESRFTDPLDDDSDDTLDEEDIENRAPHEDLNSLLVKSWETKIFPIIRRRFRNDSERKDGLEQIKGALALGMTDIARQTVEFLYEESGGIPNDLHLPTVDDIKEDLSKLSIEGMKKGMLVTVGKISEELGYKIGPETICETSSNSGEVLDVDVENELVQVETYLKLKGVLVRYWYPLSALERAAQDNKSSSNICPINSGAFDIHNPDIHREVLNMEFALSRIYCRTAYINILLYSTKLNIDEIDFENEDDSVISSVMMLQDPDIENLRLLSESLLIKSDIYGNILDSNISIHKSETLFDLFCGNLSKVFYSFNETLLSDEVKRLLDRSGGALSEILDDLFDCLKNPSKYFITEEIEINDLSILKSIVRFENSAFVSVSCKYEDEFTNYEDLTIQIQTLNGIVLKPNGRSVARDIIQYPVGKRFPPVLVAEEMVQVSHGGGGMDKRPSLLLHGIHRDFPLAIAVIETLINNNSTGVDGEDLAKTLLEFLIKLSPPLILKERILNLLLKCIKTFKIQDTFADHSEVKCLTQELNHLHVSEGKKDFSSYFIALNELILNISSASSKDHAPWFKDVLGIFHRLQTWKTINFNKENIAPNDFDRLLIVLGLSDDLSRDEIRSSILRIVDPLGGIYRDSELFVSESATNKVAILQVRFGCKVSNIKTGLERCESLHQEDEFSVIKFTPEMEEGSPAYEALNEYLSTRITTQDAFKKKLESCRAFLPPETEDKVKLMKSLMETGFDFSVNRTHTRPQETTCFLSRQSSLVDEINEYCKDYSLSPFDIHPNEVYERRYDLRAIQELNEAVKKSKLLSMISLKNSEMADHLRALLFTSIKTEFLTSKLANLRDTNMPPPELSLNPVEDIGITKEDSEQTWFVQAMNQLQEVDSRQFCVSFATGGDPELPLQVKMLGEEVLGNSGSFRHFLSRATQELLSRAIPLFVPNLGSERKGLWTLQSDEGLSYSTERFLKFFGQLMGMALRAGIPLALNLMPQNWKSLADAPLVEEDLKDFDPCSYNLISKMQSIQSEEEFEEFLEDTQFPKMSILDVSGAERDLIPEGSNTYLSWSNHLEFVRSLRDFKMAEMSCTERWGLVKAGLATLIPMDTFIRLFKPSEMEGIICGPNKVNILYIQEHTIYQVGIKESDVHVRYFWSVLESLSQSQMSKFIKFCSNQDRIQTWSKENLPPYPLKIAPASRGSGEEDDPDQRHIRVETCMFMIKLPRYSSYEVMRNKILFAISSALDPLSG